MFHPTIPIYNPVTPRLTTRQPRTGHLDNVRPGFPTSIPRMTTIPPQISPSSSSSLIIGGGNTFTSTSSSSLSPKNPSRIVNIPSTRPTTWFQSTTRASTTKGPTSTPTTQRPIVVWPTITKAPEKVASFWQNWSPNKEVEVISDNSLTHSHDDLIGPLINAPTRRPSTFISPTTPSNTDVELLDPWLLDILQQARQNSSLQSQQIRLNISSSGVGSISSTSATSIPVIR